jgi:hypothetical protein
MSANATTGIAAPGVVAAASGAGVQADLAQVAAEARLVEGAQRGTERHAALRQLAGGERGCGGRKRRCSGGRRRWPRA